MAFLRSVIFMSLLLSQPEPHTPSTGYAIRPDSQRPAASCEDVLNQPTRDSTDEKLVISAFHFGADSHAPAELGPLLTDGLRQFVTLPRPLRLSAFIDTDSHEARRGGLSNQTLEGFYLLTILRSGHISHTEVMGGTHDRDFGAAFLAAAFSLDSSGLLPPVVPKLEDDSVRVIVAVLPASQDSALRKGKSLRALAPSGNFLSFRVPVRKIAVPPRSLPENTFPIYPEAARHLSREGRVEVQFVIDSSGLPDLPSLLVLSSSGDEFTQAVWAVLPGYHFQAAVIENCPARMLVRLPFDFRLRHYFPL